MTRRPSHKFLACVLLLSGCQTGNSLLPWQAASEPRYTAEELAQRNNPQPAAARPQLAQSMQSKPASSNAANDIVAAAPPIAAGRVDQMIKSGRAAILDAGKGDTTKLDEARQIFTQVLTVDNSNSSAHHGMAIVADLQNDWSAAELHYKQALQQRPEDPSLLNDLGYSYLLQNRFFEASKYLNQAVQLSPQNERAHINLALLSLKRGDRNAAKSHLATIYSASEINSTLATLEQDLNQSSPQSSPMGGTQVAATPLQYGATQNGTAQQSGMQPFQRPMQSFAGQQPQTGQPADNHGMMAHANRPVSVYPPGVGPAITPQQNFDQGTNLGNNFGNGNGNGPEQTAGQFMQFASNGNALQQGVPVGGVINSPNTGASPNGYQTAQSNMGGNQPHAQYPSQYNAGNGAWQQQNQNVQPLIAGSPNGALSNAGSTVDHSLQAPIAGLNAGPGTLFPLGINHTPMNPQPSPQQQQQFAQMPTPQNGMQNFGGQPMQRQSPSPQAQPQYANGNQIYQASANDPARDNRPISVLPSEMPQQQGNFYPRNMSPQPQQIAPVSATQYLNQPQYGAPQQSGGMASPNGQSSQAGGAPNFQYQNNAPQPRMNMQPQPNGQQHQSFNGGSAPGSPAARMQAYDAQLQQNNNAYNQAVQQMNGQRAAFGNAQGQY